MNVIEVRGLSKRYRIGLKEKRHETLVGQIGSILRAPLDNFRKLRDLSRFGDDDESVFWALKDINFDVQQGDVLGIIGHNGAGKSTLLKILSRITEPTSGEIRVKGRISALLEVGTGFHPELTGRENIYMNGTILGMTKKEIDRKLDEIVDFSGVEKYIDTPVKFYSSGMKVRLGFAVAAHLEPEILIIDEVLAVGDAEFQRKCLGKMEDVAQNNGRTILFVSHDLAAVSALCSNSILLSNSKIVKFGNTNSVIQDYITALSMNIDKKKIKNKEGASISLLEITLYYENNNKIIQSEKIPLGYHFIIDVTLYDNKLESREFELNFEVHKQRGIAVTSYGNELNCHQLLFDGNNRITKIRINTGEILLRPDDYILNLWINDLKYGPVGMFKEISLFSVIPMDIFGCGKLPFKESQGILINRPNSIQIL